MRLKRCGTTGGGPMLDASNAGPAVSSPGRWRGGPVGRSVKLGYPKNGQLMSTFTLMSIIQCSLKCPIWKKRWKKKHHFNQSSWGLVGNSWPLSSSLLTQEKLPCAAVGSGSLGSAPHGNHQQICLRLLSITWVTSWNHPPDTSESCTNVTNWGVGTVEGTVEGTVGRLHVPR